MSERPEWAGNISSAQHGEMIYILSMVEYYGALAEHLAREDYPQTSHALAKFAVSQLESVAQFFVVMIDKEEWREED